MATQLLPFQAESSQVAAAVAVAAAAAITAWHAP